MKKNVLVPALVGLGTVGIVTGIVTALKCKNNGKKDFYSMDDIDRIMVSLIHYNDNGWFAGYNKLDSCILLKYQRPDKAVKVNAFICDSHADALAKYSTAFVDYTGRESEDGVLTKLNTNTSNNVLCVRNNKNALICSGNVFIMVNGSMALTKRLVKSLT